MVGVPRLRRPDQGPAWPRQEARRTLAEFERIMDDLKLPYPKFIDHAAPGNRRCGVLPDDLPEPLQAYCQNMSQNMSQNMTDSPQG